MTEALNRYLRACETLSPATLDDFMGLFADDARFRDPFSDVRGKATVRRVFEKMWEDVHDITFTVEDKAVGGEAHYVRWNYVCTPKGVMGRGGPLRVTGVSQIRLDETGRVVEHLDYWDPTPGIYERIPVLGRIVGMVRRQIGVR